jgi:polyisoprenoid-binding protein YceI
MSATATATAARTFVIDKAHSEAIFQVRHLVTRVRGRFTDLGGTVTFDEASPERSSVTFTIRAASVDTGTPDRDAHLRSEDFFHVEKYPEITFVSAAVKASGGNAYQITGDLTIRGVSRRITLPVTYLGKAKDPWGNEKAGFETEVSINRKDFGLVWNAALETGGFLVGDEVKISVSIQAQAAA